MVVFGLFHGLIFLPVILSWIGPDPYETQTLDHRKHLYVPDSTFTNGGHQNGKTECESEVICAFHHLNLEMLILPL